MRVIIPILDTYRSRGAELINEASSLSNTEIEYWIISKFILNRYLFDENLDRTQYGRSIFIRSWKEFIEHLKSVKNDDVAFIILGNSGYRGKMIFVQIFINLFAKKAFYWLAIANSVGFADAEENQKKHSIFDFVKPKKVYLSHKGILHHHLPSWHAVNSWDITYIGTENGYIFLNRFNKAERMVDNKYAVFIDQNLCYHIETELNGKFLTDNEKYFENCNKLFRRIKDELGIETILAYHPSTFTNKDSDKYECETKILGKTLELIRYCEFIIVNTSGSVDFAVLAGKPILFYTTDDLISTNKSNVISKLVLGYTKELRAKYLNLDQVELVDFINDYLTYDEEAYDNYKNTYIFFQNKSLIDNMVDMFNEIKEDK